MKRIITVTAVLGVVVLAALLLFLFTGLGAAIKAVVEGVGSRVTQTDVTLASADVSLTSGEGNLKGLVVGNPEGYGTKSAIELGEVSVKIDTSTVTSDVVVIREVLIDGPHVTWELGPGGSNIGVIQKNVGEFSGDDEDEGPSEKDGGPEKPGAKKDETRVVIEKLTIRGGRVDVSASFLKGEKLGAALPTIELTDIGKSKGGATPAEVAQKILEALTSGAASAVGKLNLDQLAGGVTDTVGGAVRNLKGLLGGSEEEETEPEKPRKKRK